MRTELKADLIAASQRTSGFQTYSWSAEVLKQFASLGQNSGRGFEFRDGDIVEFESLEDLTFRVKETILSGKKVQLLEVAARINKKWDWVPIWALRKKVPLSKEIDPLRNHSLYQELLTSGNDLDRVVLTAGKTFKVAVHEVTLQDKNEKSYQSRIYLLNEEEAKKS